MSAARTGVAGGLTSRRCAMSKDKGGRETKKPKAAKNVKTSGQTPAAGGAISASTAKNAKHP
jgi:hypothetical protein